MRFRKNARITYTSISYISEKNKTQYDYINRSIKSMDIGKIQMTKNDCIEHEKISIIIATKNEEETIEKLIISLLKQTYQNIEIIIIDNKSEDTTVDLVKKYILEENSKISLIETDLKGVSYARNIGLKNSTGEIAMFLDADQIPFDQFYLSKCKKFFENPNVMMVFPYEIPVIIGEASFVQKIIYCEQLKFKGYTYVPKIVRKNILEKVGRYNEELNYFEDADLLFRIKNIINQNGVNHLILKVKETGFYHIINVKKRSSLKNVFNLGLKAGYYLVPFLKKTFFRFPRFCIPFLLKRIVFLVFFLLFIFSMFKPESRLFFEFYLIIGLFFVFYQILDSIMKTRLIYESIFLVPVRLVRGIGELVGIVNYLRHFIRR